MFNKDIEYALSRTSGTWMCRKDTDKLFLVDRCKDLGRKFDEAIIEGQNENYDYEEVTFNQLSFKPGILGYVNSIDEHNSAVYLTRMPMREDWRQGLRYSQLRMNKSFGLVNVPREWFTKNIRGVADTIFNRFPTFTRAMELTEEWSDDVALSRNFCISYKGVLKYQESQVGLIKKHKLVLNKQFNFLQEELRLAAGEENVGF